MQIGMYRHHSPAADQHHGTEGPAAKTGGPGPAECPDPVYKIGGLRAEGLRDSGRTDAAVSRVYAMRINGRQHRPHPTGQSRDEYRHERTAALHEHTLDRMHRFI